MVHHPETEIRFGLDILHLCHRLPPYRLPRQCFGKRDQFALFGLLFTSQLGNQSLAFLVKSAACTSAVRAGRGPHKSQSQSNRVLRDSARGLLRGQEFHRNPALPASVNASRLRPLPDFGASCERLATSCMSETLPLGVSHWPGTTPPSQRPSLILKFLCAAFVHGIVLRVPKNVGFAIQLNGGNTPGNNLQTVAAHKARFHPKGKGDTCPRSGTGNWTETMFQKARQQVINKVRACRSRAGQDHWGSAAVRGRRRNGTKARQPHPSSARARSMCAP